MISSTGARPAPELRKSSSRGVSPAASRSSVTAAAIAIAAPTLILSRRLRRRSTMSAPVAMRDRAKTTPVAPPAAPPHGPAIKVPSAPPPAQPVISAPSTTADLTRSSSALFSSAFVIGRPPFNFLFTVIGCCVARIVISSIVQGDAGNFLHLDVRSVPGSSNYWSSSPKEGALRLNGFAPTERQALAEAVIESATVE